MIKFLIVFLILYSSFSIQASLKPSAVWKERIEALAPCTTNFQAMSSQESVDMYGGLDDDEEEDLIGCKVLSSTGTVFLQMVFYLGDATSDDCLVVRHNNTNITTTYRSTDKDYSIYLSQFEDYLRIYYRNKSTAHKAKAERKESITF